MPTASALGAPGQWQFTDLNQWWQRTDPADVTKAFAFPPPANLATYFPAPTAGEPYLGARGVLVPGSASFTSPHITVDRVDGNAYLFFTGQVNKDTGDLVTGNQSRPLESRVYYKNITGGNLAAGNVFSPSKDWTMPKYGVRGSAVHIGANPWLWSFWYGGNNSRWRIYYNANPVPTDGSKWTNESQLPVPKGLNAVAEPSPVFRRYVGQARDLFDIVYTGYDMVRKNSDIYLSRYNRSPASRLTLRPLAGIADEVLTRDAARTIWYSRHADWDASSFVIRIYPDFRNSPGVWYPVNDGVS